MTVVELMGMSQGDATLAMMQSENALAVLTGYLLIAYFIGAKLTVFQVTFVNSVFLLSRFATFLALQGTVQRNAHWNKRIQEIDASIPFGVLSDTGRGSLTAWALFCAITFGALLFMWQVRHPKTE